MKMDPRSISIESFDYLLPDEKIARYPLHERDQSKLLICKNGSIAEDSFSHIADHLPADSLIIFNETRVIHARLIFKKASGTRIEVFCLEPACALDTQLAFQQKGSCAWRCLVGNARRWKSGVLSLNAVKDGLEVHLAVERITRQDDTFLLQFRWQPEQLSFSELLEFTGHIPLPPYLNREDQEDDAVRYQTMFARNDGSVAAPTAGLHFTPDVLKTLADRNIEVDRITLHVGAGTFRPVNSETLIGHQMHWEEVIIPIHVINKLLKYEGRPIILVGTTTVRAIESIYWQGVKWLMNKQELPVLDVEQWDPYELMDSREVSRVHALMRVREVLESHQLEELKGKTSLMIAPGYRYQFPEVIITNFHQPKSTLLLLVSAFVGDDWRKAYDYALNHDFRFLSYGDSCLFYKMGKFFKERGFQF